MKFGGICIITEDVSSLAEFYSKLLQAEAEGNDVHSFVETDGAGLAIYSKEAARRDMGFDFSKHWGSGNITLQFMVDDVDSEYERIKKLGVEIEIEPTDYPWGSRSMQVRDPDGNIITFACRIGKNA
jgi:uncharacterized glyoxalase superfamily protein PhnB